MPDIAFVAVDWGTTHFRAWSVDRAGALLGERHTDHGMGTLQPADYSAILADQLTHLGTAPDVPVVICGMAGARQGWREATYLSTPCAVDALADGAITFEDQGRTIAILPGIAQRDRDTPDVMRSEETQVLGLINQGHTDAEICMPGTHTKWVRVKNRTITGFHTAMVGDLFSALKNQTILKHSVTNGTVSADSDAFADGVRLALSAPHKVLPSLFQLRASGLLFDATPDDVVSRLSGMLIGLDITAITHCEQQTRHIHLVGGNAFGKAYRAALDIAGMLVQEHDGEALAQAGLIRVGRQLWPTRITMSDNRKSA